MTKPKRLEEATEPETRLLAERTANLTGLLHEALYLFDEYTAPATQEWLDRVKKQLFPAPEVKPQSVRIPGCG